MSEAFLAPRWIWSAAIGFLLASAASHAEPFVVHPDARGVQSVEVSLDNYSYTPDHLIVKAGLPVIITLRNTAFLVPHNLVLTDPQAGFQLRQEVAAGESARVVFTPEKRGVFTFYCDKKLLFLPSHREQGMEGRLEVR
ncbi:MAG: cupredoxin domain-containing protein [Gammaproteobacteria bacterium]